MKHLLLALIATLWAFCATAGEIVATVNDVPISNFDVDARIKMIKLQHPNATVSVSDLKKQVLEALVEEEIKKQTAEKEGIKITETDIQNALNHLAEQNKTSVAKLKGEFAKSNVPFSSLEKQVGADLMWLQYVQKNKKEKSDISDEVLKNKQNEIRAELKKPSFYVAEIVVKEEDKALEIYEQLHNGGRFEELAEKFSTAPSAKKGGEVGIVGLGHYASNVEDVLATMEKGQLSRPLPIRNGYIILLLLDKKAPITSDAVPIWQMAQMAVLPSQILDISPKMTDVKSCADFEKIAAKEAIEGSFRQGAVTPLELPKELVALLEYREIGDVAGPIATPSASLFFIKCAVTNQKVVPSLDEIRSQIDLEQMALLSDQLLKQGKRYAVVEYN